MAKDLSAIRKALKSGLGTDQQARKLAKEAAAVLDPKAAATAKKLEGAFRQFRLPTSFAVTARKPASPHSTCWTTRKRIGGELKRIAFE